MKVGDKVTYVAPSGREKGIVKSICDREYVFVVYDCGGNWVDNYNEYVGVRTNKDNLVMGWVDDV